jgi:hypothetical protein
MVKLTDAPETGMGRKAAITHPTPAIENPVMRT